jgi:AAA+ superfamily predicted ATPase
MRAKSPLMVLETFEEARAIQLIKEIADDEGVNRKVITWTCTAGFNEVDAEQKEEAGQSDPFIALCDIESAKTNGKGIIYVMLDFHKFTDSPDHPEIPRKIRDLATSLQNTRKSVIFISPQFKIPTDLEKSMNVFDLPLPDRDEIDARITYTLNGVTDQIDEERGILKADPGDPVVYNGKSFSRKKLSDHLSMLEKLEPVMFKQYEENKDALINACLGLTDEEIANIISRCIVTKDLNIPAILSEKKQIIKKAGILEYFDTTDTMNEIGGMQNLKKYAGRAAKMFSKEAKQFGINPPRGILLIGLPGTGKSLFAKAISNAMQQPLLLMNMAAGRSKWVGETGQNMIKGLKTAHAISPAILWVDEIDKSISRGSGAEMHQEDSSALGTLLTDMEEKPGLFLLATCNNPQNLPSELLSRFQKIYYVDIPTEKERSEIFSIQIKAIGRDPETFNLQKLSEKSPGFVGREIRNIVQESLTIAFDEGKPLSDEIIISQIGKVKPISVKKKDVLDAIRLWCENNAEPAGETQKEPVKFEGITSRKLEI